LDEVFDGKWYHNTIQLEVTSLPGLCTFWIPVIFYIDKTGTDAFQQHGLKLIIFTTPLIRKSMCNVPTAWHILGFDLEAKSSAVKAKASQMHVGEDISCCNHHKCLDVVLESFKRAQTQKRKTICSPR
jgi:hypothetical protein